VDRSHCFLQTKVSRRRWCISRHDAHHLVATGAGSSFQVGERNQNEDTLPLPLTASQVPRSGAVDRHREQRGVLSDVARRGEGAERPTENMRWVGLKTEGPKEGQTGHGSPVRRPDKRLLDPLKEMA
jgi:hypothetical protein